MASVFHAGGRHCQANSRSRGRFGRSVRPARCTLNDDSEGRGAGRDHIPSLPMYRAGSGRSRGQDGDQETSRAVSEGRDGVASAGPVPGSRREVWRGACAQGRARARIIDLPGEGRINQGCIGSRFGSSGTGKHRGTARHVVRNPADLDPMTVCPVIPPWSAKNPVWISNPMDPGTPSSGHLVSSFSPGRGRDQRSTICDLRHYKPFQV